ncbi:MAG: biopolymer transporter ExbD [Planctomycetes bacterium]|nr:biopolymer transporter ExbD [Planctomycetota bacterium]
MGAKDEALAETKMDMTPMIDVTFQLIIFFMCNIKFKMLEGKLQTYLPKDVGVNTTPQDKVLEKVDVRIIRKVTKKELDLDNIDRYREWSSAGGTTMDQVQILLQGAPVKDLKSLQAQLNEIRRKIPAPTDPKEEDSIKMNLEPMAGVLYEDVVQVVDIALGAKFTSLTFRGIELDA